MAHDQKTICCQYHTIIWKISGWISRNTGRYDHKRPLPSLDSNEILDQSIPSESCLSCYVNICSVLFDILMWNRFFSSVFFSKLSSKIVLPSDIEGFKPKNVAKNANGSNLWGTYLFLTPYQPWGDIRIFSGLSLFNMQSTCRIF